MSDYLVQQLEEIEQSWKEREEPLAIKKDISVFQKRIKYWMIGMAVGNIALSQLLRYVLETYYPR